MAFAPGRWIVVLLGLGGIGLPLSVPPLPEDPMMAKIAPEECLAYLSLSGMATPEPGSANPTEQLLAEPEVQAMAAEVEQAIRLGMERSMSRPGNLPPGVTSDDLADMVKLVLTRPLAVYVSEFTMQHTGPVLRGGAAINLGEDAAKVEEKIEQLVETMPPQLVEKIDVGGEKWLSFKANPDNKIVAGFHNQYLLVAVGEGEIETMLRRTEGEAPAWLMQLREKLPVERVACVSHFNLKAIREMVLPMADPRAAGLVKALGFDNVNALSSVMGLDRKGCVEKTLLSINGEPRGLMQLIDEKPLSAADLAPIPQDATAAMASRLNAKKLFDIILAIAGENGMFHKDEFPHELLRMEEQLGLKVQDAFLKPFGDTLCLYDSPSEGGMLSGVTLVASLRDAKQARATEDVLMKLMTPSTGSNAPLGRRQVRSWIDTVEYNGEKIRIYNCVNRDSFMNPAWCVTDKELIVALLPQSIKAYLARDKSFKSLAEIPALAETFSADSGPVKIVYCNTRRVFDVIYPFLLTASQSTIKGMQRQGINVNAAMLPSAGAIRRHLAPTVLSVRRTKDGLEIDEHYSFPGGSSMATAPVAIATLLPAVSSSRTAARRMQSANQMKQISLALLNYEQAHRTFPPAYTVDKEGKPLLSWRVLILPYIEHEALYKQFHLDEPWDSEHNKTLIDKMPAVYKSPASKLAGTGKTNYLTVRGEKTIFPGKETIGFEDIRDGSSNTIMTVEAADPSAVVWTKPDDFEYDEKDPLKGLVGLWPDGFHAGFADGSVRFLQSSIDPNTLRLLFDRDDRQPIAVPE